MTAAGEIALFASRLQLSDVPVEVLSKLKLLILDQIGVEVACADLPWNQAILRYALAYSRLGESTVVVTGDRLDAEYAGMINGTAGHGFEIDDYHPAPTHIGCVAVPAALASAEEAHASGAEFLVAVVVAFETIARVARATMPSMIYDRGFHATCAHGVFGAAAAAARLMGIDHKQTLMALSLAASHASGTVEYSQTGGDVKRFHAGMAVAGGIRSARAAAAGMTGPATILEGRKGYLQAFSAEPKPDELTSGLGERWELMHTAIKPYAACGLLNPQIDSLREIMSLNSLRADDIDNIHVGVDRFSLQHVGTIGPEPKTTLSAQFSAHFSLAMAAVLHRNDFAAYRQVAAENFAHPAIRDLAKRVRIELDDECDSIYPKRFLAKVSLTTRDGQRLHAKAFAHRALSRDEVERKFLMLAGQVVPDYQARAIAATVDRLEHVESVKDLSSLLKVDSSDCAGGPRDITAIGDESPAEGRDGKRHPSNGPPYHR